MTGGELILSFDTATTNCSIAVTSGNSVSGRVLGSVSFESGVTHSRRLLSSIDWLLKSVDVTVGDLAALAVGLGPGSFTGLRIGLAAAKGLCHGSGIGLIGVSSLDAIGTRVVSDKLICAVLDARKKEVYSCFYRSRPGAPGDGAIRCGEPAVLPPRELAGLINEPVTMAGDGVHVYSDIFVAALGDKLDLRPRPRWPDAVQIGYLAADAFRERRFLDLDDASPEYIRTSDAQLSLVSPLNREQQGHK